MQENHRNKLDAFRESSTRLVNNESEEGQRIIYLNRHNANSPIEQNPHHIQAGYSEISKNTVSTSVTNVPPAITDFNQKFKNLKLESKFQKRTNAGY